LRSNGKYEIFSENVTIRNDMRVGRGGIMLVTKAQEDA
jgi:hypothetical protein